MTALKTYHPIDCNLYDYLEEAATQKRTVEIIYSLKSDQISSISGVVIDLYSKNKAEYLKLDNGLEIRLDKIDSFNGKDFRKGNGCSV